MPKLSPLDIHQYYMGIDPGQSGGIAIIDELGHVTLLESMPHTERQVWEIFAELDNSVDMAVIEKVHAMPKQGVSSTFKFGCGYGGLRMALTAIECPFDEVTPQAWQKALGIVTRKKEESKNDHKKKLLAKAQQLFPKERITLKTADALLIAYYCRMKYRG